MHGIIYKTTNLINGKIYVGQTVHPEKEDYIGSGRALKYAIKRDGRENFVRETLIECRSQPALDKMEEFWIKKLNSTDPKIGYNILPGTSNGFGSVHPMHIPEVAKRNAESQRGSKRRPHSEETRKRMSESAKELWDGNEERKKNISEKIKASITPERRKQMGDIWRGKKLSEDHRRNIKKNHADISGEKHPCWGKKYQWINDGINNRCIILGTSIPLGWEIGKISNISEETRKKMSESAKKKIVSEETRKKMSLINLGRKHTPEARKKISESHLLLNEKRRKERES